MATCLNCGQENLQLGSVIMNGERHGQSFSVQVNGFKCANCGFEVLDSDQAVEFTRRVSDAFKSANGLLTGEEIVAVRTQMGMNQQEFSDYIGVGVASIKRWEIGKIQDKAMDELIRLKTNTQSARRNLSAVKSHLPEPYVLCSVTMGGSNVELSIACEQQQFESKPKIRLDQSAWIPTAQEAGYELAA